MNKKRVVLAGGSGFLGRALAKELLQRDYEVVVLTRELAGERDEERRGQGSGMWDGEHIGEWIKCLDGAETVVESRRTQHHCRSHAGKPPGNYRIAASTVARHRRSLSATSNNRRASGAGRAPLVSNGNCGDQWCDESAPTAGNSLAEVCRLWEQACHACRLTPHPPRAVRIGLVLGRDGGALPIWPI